MKTYFIECYNCGKLVERENKQRYKYHKKSYCSRECAGTSGNPPIVTSCGHCGRSVVRPNGQLSKSKSKLVFCNRSCSASFNNKITKRKSQRIYKCKFCDTQISIGRRVCNPCLEDKIRRTGQTTLQTLLERRQDSCKYSPVREHARNLCRRLPKVCSNCGYDKHVEVAHLRPVKAFNLESTIKEINDLNNLCLLCPNCHWEFDNGILSIKNIRTVASIGLEPTTSD